MHALFLLLCQLMTIAIKTNPDSCWGTSYSSRVLKLKESTVKTKIPGLAVEHGSIILLISDNNNSKKCYTYNNNNIYIYTVD